MSNYVKATDFASKDALSTGDPDKLVKGSEIDEELAAVAVAIATKLNASGGAMTNCTANTQVTTDSSTKVANTAFVQAVLAAVTVIDGGTF